MDTRLAVISNKCMPKNPIFTFLTWSQTYKHFSLCLDNRFHKIEKESSNKNSFLYYVLYFLQNRQFYALNQANSWRLIWSNVASLLHSSKTSILPRFSWSPGWQPPENTWAKCYGKNFIVGNLLYIKLSHE